MLLYQQTHPPSNSSAAQLQSSSSAVSPSAAQLQNSPSHCKSSPSHSKPSAALEVEKSMISYEEQEDRVGQSLSASLASISLESNSSARASEKASFSASSDDFLMHHHHSSLASTNLAPASAASDELDSWKVVGSSPRKSSISCMTATVEHHQQLQHQQQASSFGAGETVCSKTNSIIASSQAAKPPLHPRGRASSVLEPSSTLWSGANAAAVGVGVGGVWGENAASLTAQQPSWLVDLPCLAPLVVGLAASNGVGAGCVGNGAEVASAVGAAPLCPSQDSPLPFRSRSKSQSFSLCSGGAASACQMLDSSLLFNIQIPIFDVPSSSNALRHADDDGNEDGAVKCTDEQQQQHHHQIVDDSSPLTKAYFSSSLLNSPNSTTNTFDHAHQSSSTNAVVNDASFSGLNDNSNAAATLSARKSSFSPPSIAVSPSSSNASASSSLSNSIIGISSSSSSGGSSQQQQQQHHLMVGKHFQLSSYKGLLYLVEFKSGRTEVMYVQEVAGGQPEFAVAIGNYIIVEADRGEDLGKVVGEITIDRMKAIMNANCNGNSNYSSHHANCCYSSLEGSPSAVCSSESASLSNAAASAANHHHSSSSLVAPLTQSEIWAGIGQKEIIPKRIHRLARPADVRLLQSKAQEEAIAMLRCQSKVRQKKLPMEVVDAEYQWDRNKLTFYFIADRRIDFRELVRDLFRIYKTRIWMCAVEKHRIKLLTSGEHQNACLSLAAAAGGIEGCFSASASSSSAATSPQMFCAAEASPHQ